MSPLLIIFTDKERKQETLEKLPELTKPEEVQQGLIPQISTSKLDNLSLKFTISQNSIEKILLFKDLLGQKNRNNFCSIYFLGLTLLWNHPSTR